MKTVVFVHSYCLALDGSKLTEMAEVAMATGIKTFKDSSADALIVSTAYDTWRTEADFQMEHAAREGVSNDRVHIIRGVDNSYDEALKSCRKAKSLGAELLVVIAEKWHGPRSLKAFKWACPDMKVEVVTFETPRFERALEPMWIKSVRASIRLLWIVWNVLLGLIPPRWFSGQQPIA